jgi:NADPH:quinone reductase-like Zn-dependent oxidoreductase
MPTPPTRSDKPSGPITRRSAGQIVVARSLWYVKPGCAEFRTERLPTLMPDEARIATLYSAISRGTERLVANGDVPESEWQTMRAPLQAGTFPFPVKYGYSTTGIVSDGPASLVGKTVFCLHPHQDFFQAKQSMLAVVPDGVPAKRATLAANMETALNAHWDAGTTAGDKVLIIGAGVVGLLTAFLARRIAGPDVTITDIDEDRRKFAEAIGLTFVSSSNLPTDNRIVFHTSATGHGLDSAIKAAAFEGRIMELSWYGQRTATVHLGGAFHSRRLQIIATQVGHVASSLRATVSHQSRLQKALGLLEDPRLDALVEDEVAFDEVPRRLSEIFSSAYRGTCPIIRYKSN